MGYRRFCVICGTAFETREPFDATCSSPCSEQREREYKEGVCQIFEEAVPDALDALGLESIDEYPEWKRQQEIAWVYFIQAGNHGPIKIGISGNPEKRMSHLQSASPAELRLLGVVEGTAATESNVQETFADLRLRGEWFEPAQVLLDFIDGMITKSTKR